MTRRDLLWKGAAAVAIHGALPSLTRAAGAGEARPDLTEAERARLLRALEPMHARYDAAEKMITERRGPEYQYHTNIRNATVHGTRMSLKYGVALLDTGDPKLVARGHEVMRRVIGLQDNDPQSPSFGIWGWYLEEPPAKMSPPDYNWADFLGVSLLQAVRFHGSDLPSDLRAETDAAIRRAAASIRKRDVRPGYTNIAIMGTYVTLVASELFGDADLKGYALARLKRFHEYTAANGGSFTEYNSPTYTIVALEELSRLRRDVTDPQAKPLVEDLYRAAWGEIAEHWHAPSRQWAGPHSRSYSTLVRPATLAFVDRATGGKAGFGGLGEGEPSIDEHVLKAPCPPDLIPRFTTLVEPRTRVQTFEKAERPVVGTTHLHPLFTLGSVNRGDFWNQRRGLLAYWGTPGDPAYLHVRFLHDGYDFSAARLWSAQKDGTVVAAINFATDGGDRHVSLDRIKDATIRAKDLRLRFEFGGAARSLALTPPGSPGSPVTLPLADGLALAAIVPYARFGDLEGRWEAGRDEKTAFLDVVFHEGEERAFRLDVLEQAAVAVALRVAAGDRVSLRAGARVSEGVLSVEAEGVPGTIEAPVRPAPAAEMAKAVKIL